MALGYRVRSHRVGICEFILLYLCLLGWINKPYKRGNCNLYGFIPFIFSRAQLVLIAWCSVQLCTKHGCDWVVPHWECPFGGAMFLHLEPRRFYSHNDGVIIPRASEPLRSPHRYVQGGKPKSLYKSCSFIPSCSLKYACSVAECI